jgi:hypothetical protein
MAGMVEAKGTLIGRESLPCWRCDMPPNIPALRWEDQAEATGSIPQSSPGLFRTLHAKFKQYTCQFQLEREPALISNMIAAALAEDASLASQTVRHKTLALAVP